MTMLGVNVRLETTGDPVTIRMQDDLIDAINEASDGNASFLIRAILTQYILDQGYTDNSLIESLNKVALSQHRSVRGLIRNVLRLELARRGYLRYTRVVPPRLV